jgi:Mor family transcriptional regulator
LAFRIFPTVSQILSFATISLSLSSSQEVKSLKLNRDQFYQKYAGLSVRVLQRPKDWKELVFKEWNGLNSLQLSKKYNVSVDMIKRVVDSEMRKRRKDESNGN